MMHRVPLMFGRRTNDKRVAELYGTDREHEIEWEVPFDNPPIFENGFIVIREAYKNALYEEVLIYPSNPYCMNVEKFLETRQ